MGKWIAVCVLIALLGFAIVTFNELVVARNRVRTAWADIDVQLQRRHDLIPQLAATVKGYAAYEQATLTAITELRSRAQAATSVQQRGQLEGEVGAQLTQLLALQERYPELKASANFLQLQRDLVDTENRLQSARSTYNESVRVYNTRIETFPDALLARPFGFGKLEYFQAEDRQPVKV
jgi:LemA protein